MGYLLCAKHSIISLNKKIDKNYVNVCQYILMGMIDKPTNATQ